MAKSKVGKALAAQWGDAKMPRDVARNMTPMHDLEAHQAMKKTTRGKLRGGRINKKKESGWKKWKERHGDRHPPPKHSRKEENKRLRKMFGSWKAPGGLGK